jgi:hypothetical protein
VQTDIRWRYKGIQLYEETCGDEFQEGTRNTQRYSIVCMSNQIGIVITGCKRDFGVICDNHIINLNDYLPKEDESC